MSKLFLLILLPLVALAKTADDISAKKAIFDKFMEATIDVISHGMPGERLDDLVTDDVVSLSTSSPAGTGKSYLHSVLVPWSSAFERDTWLVKVLGVATSSDGITSSSDGTIVANIVVSARGNLANGLVCKHLHEPITVTLRVRGGKVSYTEFAWNHYSWTRKCLPAAAQPKLSLLSQESGARFFENFLSLFAVSVDQKKILPDFRELHASDFELQLTSHDGVLSGEEAFGMAGYAAWVHLLDKWQHLTTSVLVNDNVIYYTYLVMPYFASGCHVQNFVHGRITLNAAGRITKATVFWENGVNIDAGCFPQGSKQEL